MTIAIGMVAPTFLIIGADSEEGLINVGLKRPSRKVSAGILSQVSKGEFKRGRILITGTGGSDFLTYLKSRIIERVGDSEYTKTNFRATVEGIIEAELIDFFSRHYVPTIALDPNRSFEPQLIVGGQFEDCRELWVTSVTTVTHIGWGAEAVGLGATVAKPVLDAAFVGIVNEHAATLVACYAIFCAKERAEGCGKDTHLFALRDDPQQLMVAANAKAVRSAEDVFREYEELQDANLNAIMSPAKIDITFAANERLTEIRARLNGIDFYPKPKHKRGGIAYVD